MSWLWPPFSSYRFPLILSVLAILAFLKWGTHITAFLTTASGLNPIRLHERSDVNVHVNFTWPVFLSNIRFLEMLWHSVLILTTFGKKKTRAHKMETFGICRTVTQFLCCVLTNSWRARPADTLPWRSGSNTPFTFNIDTMWRRVIASYCGRCTSDKCWTGILWRSCLRKNPNLTEHRPIPVFLNRRAAGRYRSARGSPGICHFSFLSNFHE